MKFLLSKSGRDFHLVTEFLFRNPGELIHIVHCMVMVPPSPVVVSLGSTRAAPVTVAWVLTMKFFEEVADVAGEQDTVFCYNVRDVARSLSWH